MFKKVNYYCFLKGVENVFGQCSLDYIILLRDSFNILIYQKNQCGNYIESLKDSLIKKVVIYESRD